MKELMVPVSESTRRAPTRDATRASVSLIIPVKNATEALAETVAKAHQFLAQWFPESFEIVLVPNSTPGDETDRSWEIATALGQNFSSVQVCRHVGPVGKGAALRSGFYAAKGDWIFFTDADLPYDLDFFNRASVQLQLGFDFVTGNRRLTSSWFHIPVALLPLAYGRHRLGLWFNSVVRFLLPIRTTDTQAGIKALKRALAAEAFARQSAFGFLFDLELFLTCHGLRFRHMELPVTLYLNTEKSTVRLVREFFQVGKGLTQIFWRNQRSAYGKLNHRSRTFMVSRYQGAKLATRFFLLIRWWLTPYSHMIHLLPPRGTFLDLGCGHGLLSLAMAMGSPERQVIGVDHDPRRIALAKEAVQNLSNLCFTVGDMKLAPDLPQVYTAITMIDVLHYFKFTTQQELIEQAYRLLEDGGTLLVREVDPYDKGLTSWWNRGYEKLATGLGFTRAQEKELFFRSQTDWATLLKQAGFRVRSERCSSFLFADILYVAEKVSV